MDDSRRLLPAYEPPGIQHWLRGVFEGGGMKGVAYRGALEAVQDNNCWFEAVAGASAGAVTAALVAGGYSPQELDKPMDELLSVMKVESKILGRLRKDGQIYPRQKFRNLLDGILRKKLTELDAIGKDEHITFEKLFAATGVKLYVVAADITRQEPMVFSDEFTPSCQVADAVVASSSIPFAFDGGMLTSKEDFKSAQGPKGRTISVRAFRTLVDGGVWTNFPMFVFTDDTFDAYMRTALELAPRENTRWRGPIVGFILHELMDDEDPYDESRRLEAIAKAYRDVYFIDRAEENENLIPLERAQELADKPEDPSGLKAWVASKLLALVSAAVDPSNPKFHGQDIRRWRAPKGPVSRQAFLLIDSALGFAHSHLVTGIAVFVFVAIQAFILGLGGFLMVSAVIEGWPKGGWDFFGPVAAIIALAVIYLAQLAAFSVIFLGPLLLNWALLVPVRRVLVGLVGTLVATPGTAPWEHRRENVIPLPIPPKLTTLSEVSEPVRTEVIEDARRMTDKCLPRILEAHTL